MFLILSLLACAEKGPVDAELAVDLTVTPDTEPLAWNDRVAVDIEATGPELAPRFSLSWEDEAGAQLPVEGVVEMEGWGLQSIQSDSGLLDTFGDARSDTLALPEDVTPGLWALVLYDADGGEELARSAQMEVADWGFVEEDPTPLLPLNQPMRATLRFTEPEGVGAVLESFIDAEPVLELLADEEGALSWRLMMWNEAWLDEGSVDACRLLEGDATLDADGRFSGHEPEVINTMDSGEQFTLFDQRIEGGVNGDGELGGVRLSGAVDMTLFESWTEGEACALIAGFGISCVPCEADPERSCLDAAVALRDLGPHDEPLVYEDLPWCSAASDDIPQLDFDFDFDLEFDCSGCASGGQGGAGWAALGLLLVGLRRRQR